MSAGLEVPQASRDALRDTDKYAVDVDPQVLAIATPVVVAELLRIAGRAEIIAAKPDVSPGVQVVMSEMAKALRGAADDLPVTS